MKSIGVHQCLIPLSKGEGHQPKFPLDFSISKIKRMFTVEVDHDILKELNVKFYKVVNKGLKSIQMDSEGLIEGHPLLKVNLYTIDTFLFILIIQKLARPSLQDFMMKKFGRVKSLFFMRIGMVKLRRGVYLVLNHCLNCIKIY